MRVPFRIASPVLLRHRLDPRGRLRRLDTDRGPEPVHDPAAPAHRPAPPRCRASCSRSRPRAASSTRRRASATCPRSWWTTTGASTPRAHPPVTPSRSSRRSTCATLGVPARPRSARRSRRPGSTRRSRAAAASPLTPGTTVFTTLVDGNMVVNRFVAAPCPGRSRPPRSGWLLGARRFERSGDRRLRAPHPPHRSDRDLGLDVGPAAPYRPAGLTACLPLQCPPARVRPARSPRPRGRWRPRLPPFGTPAAATLGVDGLRSGIVTGADAATIAGLAATLPAGAIVDSGGQPWTIWVRPLFPDELAS